MTTRRDFLRRTSLSVLGLSLASLRAETPLPRLARNMPSAEGVDVGGIGAFLDEMQATHHELHSLMMLRHGKVVAEGWWGPYAPERRHTMYSMSKSFTSTAIGLLVNEGKLTVEDKVTTFFPADLPATISPNLAALKVKHLLSMAVGSEKEPTGEVVKSEHWVRTLLAHSISHEPGSVFLYNSAATYMCSAIVTKLTGQTVLEYLTPRLFTPLGVTGMTWETCPRGINTGGWGLSITTETMAKFGQLYLQKGRWNGQQLIPAAWVEEATSFKIQQPAKPGSQRPREQDDWQQGYCYQFWRSQHGAFRGDGAFGQFTLMLPEQDAVIVMTSETKDLQGQLDLVWKHLLPCFKAQPIAGAADADAALATRLKNLKLPLPAGGGDTAWLSTIDGRSFDVAVNELGIERVTFSLKDGQLALEAKAGTDTHRILHSSQDWLINAEGTRMPGTPPRLIGKPKVQPTTPVAGAFAVQPDGRSLTLIWRYIETPHHDEVTCTFDDKREQVTLSFVNSIAALAGQKKDSRPVLTGVLKA